MNRRSLLRVGALAPFLGVAVLLPRRPRADLSRVVVGQVADPQSWNELVDRVNELVRTIK